jgi:hypothetical protein
MRFTRLAMLALLLASGAAGAADACGWEQTCDTENWLRRELGDLLP